MTDWLMVIITSVYVVATIFICVFNYKSVKASKEQTEEIKKQYIESHCPRIDIRFEVIRSGLLCFIIENLGYEPAIDVNISLCQEFIDNVIDKDGKNNLQELNNSNFYLASRQKISLFFDTNPNFYKLAKQTANFYITGKNMESRCICIDLKQYAFMLIYDSPLQDIEEHIKAIKESQKRFQDKFLTEIKNFNPNIFKKNK